VSPVANDEDFPVLTEEEREALRVQAILDGMAPNTRRHWIEKLAREARATAEAEKSPAVVDQKADSAAVNEEGK